MDRNDFDIVNPLNKDMSITRLQNSNNLDLNAEHDHISPNSHATPSDSSLSSKRNPNESIIKVGMEFDSDEHACEFYNKYAALVGFVVRKHWVNRSKVHGQVASRKFTCSREGYRRRDKRDVNVKKHRTETRTGCLAHMIIIRQSNGKYRVTNCEEAHNHDNVNVNNAKNLQERHVGDTEITEVESSDNLEIQPNLDPEPKTPESIDYLELESLDCENNLRSGRTRDMNQGDAGRLMYHFQRQHFENPRFFYAVHVDIDDKVSNIFWSDDDMVLDYEHFGDVICLDTIYRTDKKFRPYVQFIGLNHHKEEVIFGAALVYDETVDSLKWLFQTFIEAMSGKKPKCIFADIQDPEIVEAVSSVLQETKLCSCVWQIYQNTLKHLSHVTEDAESFAKELRICMFDHEDEADFLRAWEVLLDKFTLRQNEWLRWMFREKEKWALPYGITTLFLDKNSTHLIENLSTNLRSYLNPKVSVIQFFKKFEIMVNKHRYKEQQASYNTRICKPKLMANVILLKKASEIYTPKAYEVFQKEYEKCLNVVLNKCNQNEYKANIYGNPREYKLTYNSLDETVSCSCMKFELVGILCCHGLKLLDHHNIKVLPAKYIFKRWTNDARTRSVTQNDNKDLNEARRYKDLCCNMIKISSSAAKSDQAFELATRKLNEVMQDVERILRAESFEESTSMAERQNVDNIPCKELPNTDTTTLIEGSFNFDEIQVVQNVYSNQQQDTRIQDRLIQEPLVCSRFQEYIVTNGQLRQGME